LEDCRAAEDKALRNEWRLFELFREECQWLKLPFTPTSLLLQGPHIAILVSATRLEVEEGRPLGREFSELPVRALTDTVSLSHSDQSADRDHLQT
jgi:hypothetical protein